MPNDLKVADIRSVVADVICCPCQSERYSISSMWLCRTESDSPAMSVGRYIFIAVLTLSNLVVGSVGGPDRVICYGADGHVAVEGPAEQAACHARGGVAHGDAAEDSSWGLRKTGCLDLSVSCADQTSPTNPTPKLKLSAMLDWSCPVAAAPAAAEQFCTRVAGAYHSPLGLCADLASLRIVVLLI